MAKPKSTTFGEEFEPILLSAWNSKNNELDQNQILRTRQAIVQIRKYYRFEQQYPSKINYGYPKNRAGYLASFGQRHAYLTYFHLKRVETLGEKYVPQPDNKGSITVTVLGAGAGLEVYGLCLYYCEHSQRIKKLRLNLIEKVEEWHSTRNIVFHRWIKGKFPKLAIHTTDINADLTKDCIQLLAQHYERLSTTDILIIYNVMNEIDVKHAARVWGNIYFIMKNCDKNILVLLMEPYSTKAMPRVDWIIEPLSSCSEIVHIQRDEEICFSEDPIKIELEGTGKGINDRLFNRIQVEGAANPTFQTTLRRAHLACFKERSTIIDREGMLRQHHLYIKRSSRGRFTKRPVDRKQPRFPGL